MLNHDWQFNRGTSAMQRYVASRPMFIDVEIMAMDARTVLGEHGLQGAPNSLARGLSTLYKEIVGNVPPRCLYVKFIT